MTDEVRPHRPGLHKNASDAGFEGFDWVPTARSKGTVAPPGTHEKIAVLRRRLENGEQLWAEDDATGFSETSVFSPRRSGSHSPQAAEYIVYVDHDGKPHITQRDS